MRRNAADSPLPIKKAAEAALRSITQYFLVVAKVEEMKITFTQQNHL
jgi:hypothetical protein